MSRAVRPAFSHCSPAVRCAVLPPPSIPAGAWPRTRPACRRGLSGAMSTRFLPAPVCSRPAVLTLIGERRARLRISSTSFPCGGGSKRRTAASRCASACRCGSAVMLPTSCARRPARRRSGAACGARSRRRGGAIAVWASRAPAGLAAAARRYGIPLVRVEDGFVRSVGLGSDFLPAASLVLDRRGMYFDPAIKSDLEVLLRESAFDARLIERARRLIALLVARGVTKYNLPAGTLALAAPPGKRRLLVPGQVEDDLSVRLGGGDIQGNLELLRLVRAANPDAFILYKPHPDVEAGHRKGAVPEALARRFADAVIRGVSTASALDAIDELHTLTSLAGFEALLRRRKVVVYGRPFYAGWGLTTDLAMPFRGRRLSLEELVAGVLILYPRYVDPVTRLPCGPELIVERLADPGLWRGGAFVALRRLEGALRRCGQAWALKFPGA